MADERRATAEEARAWIGRQVARSRAEACMSVAEVGELAGLKTETVELIEQGREDPLIEDLFGLAGAMGVAPSRLLEGLRWECSRDTDGHGFYVIRDAGDG